MPSISKEDLAEILATLKHAETQAANTDPETAISIKLNAAELAYIQIRDAGFNYPNLALGVLHTSDVYSSTTSAGGAAMSFMVTYADEIHSKQLSEIEIAKIKFEMCQGYVETLLNRDEIQTSVTSEIDYVEATDFHQLVFENNELDIDAWTIKTILNLNKTYEDKNEYWNACLEAAGNPQAESNLMAYTFGFLALNVIIHPTSIRDIWNWGDSAFSTDAWYAAGGPALRNLSELNSKNLDSIGESYLVGIANTQSPIVFDLDGDGIELSNLGHEIFFDHTGVGIANSTRWVGSDDGLLAIDLNDNGIIDSGIELFGSNTLIGNGSKAADGFEAMAAIDSNGNGFLDQADTLFSSLRVWRDLNQDGLSQQEELLTLSSLGISSINTDSDNSLIQFSDGSYIEGIGTYTASGPGGTVSNMLGDVWFAQSTVKRHFTTQLEIPDDYEIQVDLNGSGAVRDLRQASLLSSDLFETLLAYSATTSRSDQITLTTNLISQWADSSESFSDYTQRTVNIGSDGITVSFSLAPNPTSEQLAKRVLLDKIKVIEVFTANDFFKFEPLTLKTDGTVTINYFSGSISVQKASFLRTGNSITLNEDSLVIGANQITQINNTYQQIVDAVYSGLLFQTRLQPYADSLTFSWLDSSYLHIIDKAYSLFETNYIARPAQTVADLMDWLNYSPSIFKCTDRLTDLLVTMVKGLGAADIVQLKTELGTTTSVQIGTATSETLRGAGEFDFLFGHGGVDTLYGGAGNDLIDGGDGNDKLYGDDGNDILVGNLGNDVLAGGNGSDQYLFNRGWGDDTISNVDASENKIDAIVFGSDIRHTEISVSRSGSSLILSLNSSTTDKVTVSGFFNSDGASTSKLEEVRFSDGTTWTIADVKALALTGNASANTITGYASDDILVGQGGNDTLSGGDGNDTLIGGTENDTLTGGQGSDSYVFKRGDGQDVIINTDIAGGAIDSLNLGIGLDHSNVWLRQKGTSLEISVVGSTDKITLSSWYSNAAGRVDLINGGDGLSLTSGKVQGLVDLMASFGVASGNEGSLTQTQIELLGQANHDAWALMG